MATARIATRTDTAAAWTAANPTLAAGEWGHETDTGRSKLGDGTTAWAGLGYKLGTAATANVTTSDTDTTAERVMRVGDFGVGSLVGTIGADAAANQPAGFYKLTSSQTGYPTVNGVKIVWGRDGERNAELWASATAATPVQRIYFRTGDLTQVTEFQELYHTGNYPSDTAWTTVTALSNGWTGAVRYIKRAGMVTVSLADCNGVSATDGVVITLPGEYRPANSIDAVARQGHAGAVRRLTVHANGFVMSTTSSVSIDVRGSITYPVIT